MRLQPARRSAFGIVALVGIVGPAALTAAGQDVTLRYRWTNGEQLTYRLTQQTTSTVSGLPGGLPPVTVEMNASQVLRTSVEGVAADGTATVRSTYESARWEMKSPAGTMLYDSAADTASADRVASRVKDTLSALIGGSFTMTLSPRGEVLAVEGMTQLVEKMFKSFPSDPSIAPFLTSLRSSLTDEGLRGTLGQGFTPLPEGALKPGDTWENELTRKDAMAGEVAHTTRFTLKAVESGAGERLAQIAAAVSIKLSPAGGMSLPMGFKMQLGDASGEGELTFDVERGRLQKSVTRLKFPMEMSAPGPDGGTMNMKTVADGVITFELLPTR
jgi:hypothetical protein